MTPKIKKEDKDSYVSINKRLDCLIRLIAETLYQKERKIEEADVARMLATAGLTPKEIATILGRTASSLGSALYRKKTGTTKRNQSPRNGKIGQQSA